MLFFFSAHIIAAVFSTKLSSRAGIPVLIAFMGIGILVGSDVLNLFYFDDAALTKNIADILLIFILFVGGFQTRRSSLQAVAGPSLTLARFAGKGTLTIHILDEGANPLPLARSGRGLGRWRGADPARAHF